VTELAQFAGRFHPLLVHFPIALLLLAALLRVIEGRLAPFDDRLDPAYRWSRLVLALGALAAVAAASTGWLLGTSGEYAGDVFNRHQQLGIAIALVSTLALAAAYLEGRLWRRAESVLLTLAVLLIVPAGHYGATLTHGEGFLTEHAPPLVKSLLGEAPGPASTSLAGRSPEHIGVYTDIVAPVFRTQCVSCHGPTEAEGGLRLDTADGLSTGGDHGKVIAAGRAGSSELVRRIYLPTSHKDAMPPKGHRRLSPSDAALVRWWVESGARFDLTLADAEFTPEVMPTIEAIAGPVERGGPTLPAVTIAEATPEAIAGVTSEGFSVVRIADGQPFLHVHTTNAAVPITDASLAVLARIAPQVLWLDLGATRISDRGLNDVARLPNLTRLHLQHTQVGDEGVARLTGLSRLEYLNLYGTAVTDHGLVPLASLTHLRALYLWKTDVTPAGVSRLRAALPRLTIETGMPDAGQSGSAR
jgi:uncharacterized membrane protein